MNINFVIWDIIQSSLFFKLCSSNCFSLTIGKSFSWLLSLFFFIFYILASIWAFSLSFSLSVSIPSPFFTLSSLLSVITRYSRVKAASIFCYRAKIRLFLKTLSSFSREWHQKPRFGEWPYLFQLGYHVLQVPLIKQINKYIYILLNINKHLYMYLFYGNHEFMLATPTPVHYHRSFQILSLFICKFRL